MRDQSGTIVCIGGSHTWGGGVAREERYSDLLGSMTGRQVLNCGHLSLGLDQVYLAITRKLSKFRPQVIIVEQYPWALVRVLNNFVNGFVKPVVYLDAAGGLRIREVPHLARFSKFRAGIGSFYAYRKELREFRSGILLTEHYDPMLDPIFLLWKQSHYDHMYRLSAKIIENIRDHCIANRIRLIFAVGTIYQQFQAPPLTSALIDYELPRKRLKGILTRLNIPFVDMSDPMLREHTVSDPVIFPDGHINVKGNRIFATELARDLAARNWL
jgi:hypothetical protein